MSPKINFQVVLDNDMIVKPFHYTPKMSWQLTKKKAIK
jgi:hypothetical protein